MVDPDTLHRSSDRIIEGIRGLCEKLDGRARPALMAHTARSCRSAAHEPRCIVRPGCAGRCRGSGMFEARGRAAPPRAAATATAAKPAPADGGIDWSAHRATPRSTPPSPAHERSASRCSSTGARSGARRATSCRRRCSTGRTSSSARAPSSPSTSTATSPARRSSAPASPCAATRPWCCSTRSGRELTRLPGEVDAQQVQRAARPRPDGARPASEVLALARTGGQGLSEADWRLLAFYSWETDQQQLVGKAARRRCCASWPPPARPSPAGRDARCACA